MKERRSARFSEAQLQKQVCGFLSIALKPPAWFSCFPSDRASGRGKIGLKLGVPDILIIHECCGCAYWIELKVGRNQLSIAQQNTANDLVEAGCNPPAVCRSLEEVIAALKEWGIPLRPVRLAA
jgi:hypothetical protein